MTVRILTGDVRERLLSLPDGSVQCVVTSPPYFGLRDYGVDGQIGLEPTLAEYVATLVSVFREVRRVLRDDGTCWLNLGDSYGRGARVDNINDNKRGLGANTGHVSLTTAGAYGRGAREHLKPKDLMMVPARVALALQEDGWWLRSDIIWAKKNCMPESVTDRPTSSHEHIFLLTKSARYYYDAEAVREESVSDHPSGNGYKRDARLSYDGRGQDEQWQLQAHRNQRNVWHLATEPFPEAHFATFPSEIPRRCIKAGSRVGDTVLDPFLGSGTTLLVADQLGRDGVGIELNPEYAKMAENRIRNNSPMFAQVSAA